MPTHFPLDLPQAQDFSVGTLYLHEDAAFAELFHHMAIEIDDRAESTVARERREAVTLLNASGLCASIRVPQWIGQCHPRKRSAVCSTSQPTLQPGSS